jgi:hypothetical protein
MLTLAYTVHRAPSGGSNMSGAIRCWVFAMTVGLIACTGKTTGDSGAPGDEQDVKSKTLLAAEGATCGGIANIRCQSGLFCKGADPNTPDSAGTCKMCLQTVQCGGTGHFDFTVCDCVPNETSCIQNVQCGGTGHFDFTACACVPN